MLNAIKDFYLGLRYGYTKRPKRIKLHGLAVVAPLKFKHDEDHYKKVAVVDISSSGIGIESFDEFKVGDEVMMMFILPTHRISIAGIVMRRKQISPTWIYGIKYDMKLTPKNQIRQVLSYAKAEMKRMKADNKPSE